VTLHFVHPHDRACRGCERGEGALEVDGFAPVVLRHQGSRGGAHPEVSRVQGQAQTPPRRTQVHQAAGNRDLPQPRPERGLAAKLRSEEHTSELQSLAYLVCRLLLEKKKKKKKKKIKKKKKKKKKKKNTINEYHKNKDNQRN